MSISRVAALLVVALLAAGTAYRAAWQHGGDRAVGWSDESAALAGVELHRPVATSFGRQADLARYLAPAVPRQLGFGGRQAVLIATGARSSAGYSIEVLGVREERSRVVVSVRERTPSSSQPAPATLTFPYRLITVAVTGKHIEVEWRGRP